MQRFLSRYAADGGELLDSGSSLYLGSEVAGAEGLRTCSGQRGDPLLLEALATGRASEGPHFPMHAESDEVNARKKKTKSV